MSHDSSKLQIQTLRTQSLLYSNPTGIVSIGLNKEEPSRRS